MKADTIIIFVTCKDSREATRISEVLLDKKQIACANILKDVQSLFWWQGKKDRARESLLVLKTRRSLFSKVIKTVKVCHSYDVPEIIGLPIMVGDKNYLQWIKTSTQRRQT